jgi:hypothetical protein
MRTCIPEWTLTCRTAHAPRFLALGLTPIRVRGELTDFERLAVHPSHTGPASSSTAARRRIAADGIPFYGHASRDRDGEPVVFASDGWQYAEAPASPDHFPTVRLLDDAYPALAELALARTYFRCLAAAVLALPDPSPWLPRPRELAAPGCSDCGGRGWFLVEDELSALFQVVACDVCRLYPDDAAAGLAANAAIETGRR